MLEKEGRSWRRVGFGSGEEEVEEEVVSRVGGLRGVGEDCQEVPVWRVQPHTSIWP